MIGIQGKYLADFSLKDKPSFINQDDLLDFTLIEQAGNIPPIFTISFLTDDDELPQYINEGTELQVTLGQTLNDSEKYSLLFQNSESTKVGNNRHLITATGVHNSIKYFDTDILITDKMNGATALENISSKFYIVDSNLDKASKDTMYWKQYNISSKKFINDIWLATYIDNSFPLVGITSQGKMLLKDMKKLIKDNTWDLADSTSKKFIDIAPDYKITSKKGFFNTYVGVGREKFLYNQDDAIGLLQSEDVKSFLALTNKLSVNADREKKAFENGIINENVHANYWKAYLRNITSLANYSAITLNFNFQNIFKPVHIYDTIYHKEISTTNLNASTYATGTYIITKVVKRLQGRQYITLVDACKESFNDPKGNLK